MSIGFGALIQIVFSDRPGLGYDVFQVFENFKVEKVAMEVSIETGMIIKFICGDETSYQALIASLRQINGVVAVNPATNMPFEDRENQLRTILDVVSEGIIAVTKEGTITQINEAAKAILQIDIEVVGHPINELLDERMILSSIHSGQANRLFESRAMLGKHPGRYWCSSQPIIDKSGTTIGAVITIKGEEQIDEIMKAVHDRVHLTTFSDIIYQSEIMRKLLETAKTVARSHSTVLLRGESGTGKERFAHAIHMASPRRSKPFVAVNSTALPESLFESELFGYEQGAFTGAMKEGKKGLFEQAHTGTLFLDEIGELPLSMQARLLRTLQEGTIRKVGGNKEIPVDVRIIAATHRNLEQLMEEGRFREDLYYRLNVVPLFIPPLRLRIDDIPLLAQHLLRKLEQKLGKTGYSIHPQVFSSLASYPWPGNVRQLENTLEHVINVVPEHSVLMLSHFSEWLFDQPSSSPVRVSKEAQQIHVNISKTNGWPTLKEIVAKTEAAVIEEVMREFPSSRKAGNVLGVSNTTILNKLHQLQ